MKKTDLQCFGRIDIVFPMGGDGLRHTPASCFQCPAKTECLKTAMTTTGGVEVKQEMVDRAYDTGLMGFFERWSRKKTLNRRLGKMKKSDQQ